jgi:hypothetical protein
MNLLLCKCLVIAVLHTNDLSSNCATFSVVQYHYSTIVRKAAEVLSKQIVGIISLIVLLLQSCAVCGLHRSLEVLPA